MDENSMIYRIIDSLSKFIEHILWSHDEWLACIISRNLLIDIIPIFQNGKRFGEVKESDVPSPIMDNRAQSWTVGSGGRIWIQPVWPQSLKQWRESLKEGGEVLQSS